MAPLWLAAGSRYCLVHWHHGEDAWRHKTCGQYLTLVARAMSGTQVNCWVSHKSCPSHSTVNPDLGIYTNSFVSRDEVDGYGLQEPEIKQLLTWSMAQGIKHRMSFLSLKICGNDELKDGAAWMAGKLIFPRKAQTDICDVVFRSEKVT